MPEVHVVEVQLEDLVLGLRLLQADGVLGFLDLPLQRLFVPRVEVLDELLGDGGPALHDLAGADVRHQGSPDCFHVHGTVVVEGVVLDRQHRVLGVVRDLGELHRNPVLVRDLRHDGTVGGEDLRPERQLRDGQRLTALELLT